MGCGQTLVIGTGRHITCARAFCPNPAAADQILESGKETQHLVDLDNSGFSILHPLRERLDDDEGGLWGCALHSHIQSLSGPPVPPGRYRAFPVADQADGTSWIYEEVPR